MIFLTINKNEVGNTPNKSITFKVKIHEYINENVKNYGGKPATYYTYAFKIIDFIKPDGENWSDIECLFDAPLELHNILKSFHKDQEAIIQIRLLKSNGKPIMYWGLSKLVGENIKIDKPIENKKVEPIITETKNETNKDIKNDKVNDLLVKFCGDCKNDYEISQVFRNGLRKDGIYPKLEEAILSLSIEEQNELNEKVGLANKFAINVVKNFIERNKKLNTTSEKSFSEMDEKQIEKELANIDWSK